MNNVTPRNQNDSEPKQSIDEGFLAGWRRYYPTISALFRDLECPRVFRCLAKTPHAVRTFQDLLNQWIKLGRPEVMWPEPDRSQSSDLGKQHSQTSLDHSYPDAIRKEEDVPRLVENGLVLIGLLGGNFVTVKDVVVERGR